MNKSPQRIASIDVFRAITMFLMIFVNDLWTLQGVPKWLEHASANEDFLGFADTIFPAFLFIVGMAIPYSVQNRIRKGESAWQILGHIFIRSLILMIMGIFTVNLPELNESATGLSSAWFQILMVAGFFLAWNEYPLVEGKFKLGIRLLIWSGFILLAFLVFLYKGGHSSGISPHGMEISWWGILGLIGWSYLLSAALYLLVRHRKGSRMLTFLMILLLYILHWTGFYNILGFDPVGWIPGNGALQVFTFGGILLASHLQEKGQERNVRSMFTVPVITATVLMISGFLLRHWWIISKIQATPSWVLLCTGINILAFLGIWYVADQTGRKRWFRWIEPGGTATLSCYILPYLWYSLLVITGFQLPLVLRTGIPGLLKSLLFSWCIITLAGLLSKIQVKLKL